MFASARAESECWSMSFRDRGFLSPLNAVRDRSGYAPPRLIKKVCYVNDVVPPERLHNTLIVV